jgi:hypothetical protein
VTATLATPAVEPVAQLDEFGCADPGGSSGLRTTAHQGDDRHDQPTISERAADCFDSGPDSWDESWAYQIRAREPATTLN